MSQTDPTLAEMDPIVRGLLPGYIARRWEELASLTQLLEEKRFEELRVIGHNLSGSGGAYGLPGLTEIGRSIESAAASADQEVLGAELQNMAEYLVRVGSELA